MFPSVLDISLIDIIIIYQGGTCRWEMKVSLVIVRVVDLLTCLPHG